MKKLILFSMLGLLLLSCSEQQDLAVDNDGSVPSQSNFISVSIVASGAAGTRAGGSGYQDDQYGKDYRDGTENENKAKEVLLLFFDKDGNPASATKDDEGNYLPYILWEVPSYEEGDHSETVEVMVKKVIHITVPHKNNQAVLPTQLLAVINPPAEYKTTLVGKSLMELRNMVDNYESYLTDGASLDTTSDEEDEIASDGKNNKTNFVMTNSVFLDNEKNIVDTTPLKEENFCADEQTAEANPVVIYVERVLARIDLNIALTGILIKENGEPFYIYKTGTIVENDDKTTDGSGNGSDVSSVADALNDSESTTDAPDVVDDEVYVRLLGWNVFDTPNKSRLMKHIDAGWTDNVLFGTQAGVVEPWNATLYHRSFWAINPPVNEYTHESGTFFKKDTDSFGPGSVPTDGGGSDWNYAIKYQIPVPDKYATAYFQENAAPAEYPNNVPDNPSKVVIAAQLVDASGNPRELAKWAGKYYYTWDGLKAHLCKNMLDLWYVAEDDTDKSTGNTTRFTYKRILPEHLDYETQEGSHLVTVVLSTEGKKIQWFSGTKADDLQELTTDQVGEHIKTKIGSKSVMLWKDGYTYFSFTIRHLGLEEGKPGYYGVVRNHIYDTTIRSISGLGTPVPDTSSEITITPPSEDTGVLAATVKILSWRVVKQSYDLTW